MKIIAIGDIHGRTTWKNIIAKEQADKIVFVGDYFDSHDDISAEQQKHNFEDILRYKEAHKDKVILLTGNHDFHYLSAADEHYSGYNRFHAIDIEEMLTAAIGLGLVQMCYIQDEYIFVHAGFTKTWCRDNIGGDVIINGIDFMNVVNDLFRHQPGRFAFAPGEECNMYGDEIEQSPIWVRPASLYKDKLDGFTQVVGHTIQKQINYSHSVWLIDNLANGQYLCIDSEMAEVRQVAINKTVLLQGLK